MRDREGLRALRKKLLHSILASSNLRDRGGWVKMLFLRIREFATSHSPGEALPDIFVDARPACRGKIASE